jgi:hypothetical protein
VWGCALACMAGCSDDRVYLGNEKMFQVAITENTAPFAEGDEDALYLVETRVELPIRRPTESDVQDLYMRVGDYPDLPFPRLPWVERGDVELTVDFTLANLDGETRDVDVIINAGNEFDEYFPGVLEVEDNPVPLHSQWERRYTLEGKSRLSRTVREEELDEAAVDLATVVNGAPNSDQIVYFENKSARDERSRRFIPAVIPGIAVLRLGLRSSAPVRLLLEATVRARDVSEKLAEDNEPRMYINPDPFMPVIPEP